LPHVLKKMNIKRSYLTIPSPRSADLSGLL
jgi:hypothetical protein